MLDRNEGSILIVGPEGIVNGEKALFDHIRERVQHVPLAKIRDGLHKTLSWFGQVIYEIPQSLGSFNIDEIELTLEIDIQGEVRLIGGLRSGTKGGLTLKLKRKSQV